MRVRIAAAAGRPARGHVRAGRRHRSSSTRSSRTRRPPVLDSDFEYIELLGTPNMKAGPVSRSANVNGVDEKLYPIGSIPPPPNPDPEIDESSASTA